MPNWKKIIVSGSDASLSSAYIEGNLTASAAYLTSASIGHLETIYETASVIYSSGSTKFGDTSDDTHERTGSVDISGSLIVDGDTSLSNLTVTNTSADDSILLLTTTEDSSNAGPVITLKRNSSTPADADYIGQLKFKGENDADQEVVYAKITAKINDASDGSEDGLIEFANRRGGLNVITARFNSEKLQLLNGTDLEVDGDVTADNFTGTASIADFATTASHALNVPDTASHALTAITSSHTAGTASFANTATTASYASTGDGVFSGSFSGSFDGVNPFPFTGSGEMQGQLIVESFNDYVDDYVESYFAGTAISSNGDIALTGSIFSPYINADSFTGSLLGTASYAVTASHVIGGGGGGDTAISSSLAETASFYEGSVTSASFSETASFYGGSVISASLSETASFVEIAQTASYMTTGSFKQPVQFVKTEPATASLYHLHIMSASSDITMSLPEGTSGDWFKVSNMLTGSLLETYGSQNIMSASGDLTLDTANAGLELIYTDDINGWVIIGN